MKRGLVITIDGPAGSGKSTCARLLAKRLGYLYLDTGAMYRAIALKAIKQKIPLANPRALGKLAQEASVTFRVDPRDEVRVLCSGEDVTEAIRRREVAEAASRIAAFPGLRKELVKRQRAIGIRGRVVAEGRDTGTVVFPRADLKVYLTATLEERVRRRLHDLRVGGGKATFSEVLQDLRRRDARDRARRASPLKVAVGALRINNSQLQCPQVVAKIEVYVQRLKKR